MALRGWAVVVLVERRGGYCTDVVCDAHAIMWALQHTSVQTVSPHCHGVTGLNPLVARRFCVAGGLKVVVVRF